MATATAIEPEVESTTESKEATEPLAEFTAEDLLEIQDRAMPELIDGQLLEREMGQESDEIAMLVAYYLCAHVFANKLGRMNGAQGSYQIFPGRPRTVRIPDVSFTRAGRVPPGALAEGHGRVAPDLVVEVTSPNDKHAMIEAKIEDYLSAGIPLIWVLVPETRTVQVIRGDRTGQRLRVGDFLDGENVVPGFRCELAALFP